jgi:F-type H+-transporting ATPase subunit epsilon
MAATFDLEIATPERLMIHEQVSEAQIPAANGEIGVLPDHAPLISELGVGELSYTGPNGKHSLVVSDGWVEIRDNHVRVLADHAERGNEIDVQRAESALKRAQDRLANPGPEVDVARALNAMKRAQARIAAARGGASSNVR